MSTLVRSRTLRKLIFLSLLVVTPVTRAADRERMNEVGQGLMCICGCNMILTKCNHLNCPTSGPMLKELQAHLDSGESEEQVIAAFAEKYGYTVLSEPPAKGFNMLAYVLPFAALFFGALVAIFVARTWKKAVPQTRLPIEMAGAPGDERLKKVEEELKEFTPED